MKKRLLNYCIWALIIASLACLLPEPKVVTPPKQFLKLWFKTANTGLSQLYWNSSGNFSEQDSEKSTIYAQKKFISQKYLLPDRYSELRFSPFKGAGSFELKDIAIVNVDDKLVRQIGIDKVKPQNQIKKFTSKENIINAETNGNSTDPMLTMEDSFAFQYPSFFLKYATNIKTFLITFIVVVAMGFLADFSEQDRGQRTEDSEKEEE